MAASKGGLGKGLGALITRTDEPARPERQEKEEPATPSPDLVPMPDGVVLSELPVDKITPNPAQPRRVFDEDALQELADSIDEVGVLQPIVVRRVGDGYELIMGERRLRASQLAGKTTVPAIIRETQDEDLLRDALLENLHRVQLNPLEEAAAYEQLLQDFGCSQEQLATRIKRSRPHISNTIRLLKLPAPVQRRVAAGVLSAGHARALLGLDDQLAMERLAQRIVAEGLSVRATEELVALGQRPQKESRPRTPREPSPRAVELSTSLSDRFDTRVRVDIGKNKGQLVIEFAGEDDLDRILSILRQGD